MQKIQKNFISSTRRAQAGFSLVEIMIVLGIIGLIFSFVGPNIMKQFKESKIKGAKIQIASYEQGLQAFYLDNNRYPHTAQGLEALIQPPTIGKEAKNWNGPYLKAKTIQPDPWGQPYIYECEDYQKYTIHSSGPDETPNNEDDISSQ